MNVCMMKGREQKEVLTKCGKRIVSPIHDRRPGWATVPPHITCPDCLASMGVG